VILNNTPRGDEDGECLLSRVVLFPTSSLPLYINEEESVAPEVWLGSFLSQLSPPPLISTHLCLLLSSSSSSSSTSSSDSKVSLSSQVID